MHFCRRTLRFLQTAPAAALAFYSHVHHHVPVANVSKLILILHKGTRVSLGKLQQRLEARASKAAAAKPTANAAKGRKGKKGEAPAASGTKAAKKRGRGAAATDDAGDAENVDGNAGDEVDHDNDDDDDDESQTIDVELTARVMQVCTLRRRRRSLPPAQMV